MKKKSLFMRIGIRLVLAITLILLLVFTIEYIHCPVYTFEKGEPFHGEFIYNPYANMDAQQWHKANFQVQSHAWGGLTSGSGNSNQAIHDLYRSLGYDIIATSDYQKINRWGKDSAAYLPVYEHGYGIWKRHQVLLGSKNVLWTDYPFFQTLSNKQHIINQLREDNDLIYIAHPFLRKSYTIDDFKKLNNYDGIEVLSNCNTSFFQWDAALSSGNYVTILSNDDAHDISNPDEIGHHCTFVNFRDTNQSEIFQALKSGNAFAAKIHRDSGESFDLKRQKAKHLPTLDAVRVRNDSLFVQLDSLAIEIRFYGQNRKTVGLARNVRKASCRIHEDDTYIRTEIEFADHTTYFLNPICRYNGIRPANLPLATIDHQATLIQRIIGYAGLFFILLMSLIIWRKHFRRQSTS